jgi:hypothetical protein
MSHCPSSDYEHEIISSLKQTVNSQRYTIDQLVAENNQLKNILATLSQQQYASPYSLSANALQSLHGADAPINNNEITCFDTYISDASASYSNSADTAGDVDIFEEAGITCHGRGRMWITPLDKRKKKKKKRRNSITKFCGQVRDVICFSAAGISQ